MIWLNYLLTHLDLVAAPFGLTGYLLNRKKHTSAWIYLSISNILLTILGIITQHWGLLIAGVFVILSFWNYITWRRDGATTT
jgi:hypothetical protein